MLFYHHNYYFLLAHIEIYQILSVYPLLKKEEVQKILDTTEFEISFRTNSSNENEVPYFKTKIEIATINSMNATLRCLDYF